MIRKLKVPGMGTVEIDLQMHPSVKPDQLHVTKISAKFFVIKHREFQDPTDMQLIAGIRGRDSAERDEHQFKQLEEKKKKTRSGDNPIAGHIGG